MEARRRTLGEIAARERDADESARKTLNGRTRERLSKQCWFNHSETTPPRYRKPESPRAAGQTTNGAYTEQNTGLSEVCAVGSFNISAAKRAAQERTA